MKKLKMLKTILKQTNSDKILYSYIIFIFIVAFIIFLAEDGINTYGDALWYCYEVISTTGFGEFTAVTLIARICSILITTYSLIVIAIITGVVTNFYIQLTQLKNKETLVNFFDRLEKLPELKKEELEELAENIKKNRYK